MIFACGGLFLGAFPDGKCDSTMNIHYRELFLSLTRLSISQVSIHRNEWNIRLQRMDPNGNWIYIEPLGKGFLPGTVWTLPERPGTREQQAYSTKKSSDRRANPSTAPSSPKRKTELKK